MGLPAPKRCASALAILATALLAAPAVAAGKPRIVAEERVGPRIVELTIATPAFEGPTKVHVNLPVGYGKNRARRWPVTYFLAGTMNTYKTFNTLIDGAALTKPFPAILVSPNGDSGYWSDWYNRGRFGPPKYETYVVRQLIPLIESRFRAKARRSQRAVIGTSMGGYGAMMVAARHPDLFGAAASISGTVDSNLIANGTVLTLSPALQGGELDAIYGPRLTQEVRWRGHNPTDLARNLRGVDLQLRAANGLPNPGIGEQLLSADTVSCIVEAGTYMASVSMHDRLASLGVPHEWSDYGAGCHSAPNFERQIVDTFRALRKSFAKPGPRPSPFGFEAIEPRFRVWGWSVRTDPQRPLEFLRLDRAGRRGVTLTGSGRTTIRTAPLFRGARSVRLAGATRPRAVPDGRGRIRFTVDLGPPSSGQQYTLGASTRKVTKRVTFEPQR